MGWFRHWFGTSYYKLLYGHRDDADAAVWVSTIMERWQLPARASVLDLACGRGRHAQHLMRHDLRVSGLDISAESIAEACTSVPGAVFHVHDMREPLADARFDAICCLFTSLGYFEDLADDQRVLDAVSEMLNPGGRCVLDFMNTPLVLRELVEEEVVEAGGVTFRITRRLVGDVLVKRITASDSGCEHRYEERVQALLPEQIEAMAERAGLVVEDRTDGPDPRPFDPVLSQRFVLWARKPHA